MRYDSVFVDLAAPGQRDWNTYVLRSGQQYIRFYREFGNTARTMISTDDGASFNDVLPPNQLSSNRIIDWNGLSSLSGTIKLHIRFVFEDNEVAEFKMRFIIVEAADKKFSSSDSSHVYLQNNSNRLKIIRRSEIFQWSLGNNDYQQRDRPLLVVEGIDADNKNSAASYLALGSNTANGTQDALFPLSLYFGADVGILDFADGGRDMVHNAQVVRGAVRFFRDRRSRPTVGFGVVGVSMGGVVARYALAEMEDEQSRGLEQPHGVAHFISLDAPQQGAVIDASLQDDIKALSEINSSLQVPAALNSTAGKQLLSYAAFDSSTPSRHVYFWQQMQALNGNVGYPQQTDNIGVSFGTPLPRNNQEWLEMRLPNALVLPSYWSFCNGIICRNRHYNIVGNIASGGSSLPRDQANQWGSVFQIFSYEMDRSGKPDPTFIPYTSALDINGTGASSFDTTLTANFARSHNDVPFEIVRPLLRRIGYLMSPPAQPLLLTVDGPHHVPTNPGSWTASINRDQPNGFSFSWRYRLDLSGACGLDDEPLLRTTASARKKPGDITPNLIDQCVWTNGLTGPTFSYSITANAWLDLEVTATNGTDTLISSRRVRYGSFGGGGGDLLSASSPSNEESANLARDDAAATVGAFKVLGVRPSVAHVGEHVVVAFALPEGADVEVSVRDMLGRLRRRMIEARPAGHHRAVVPLDGLRAGVYLVTVRAGERLQTVRFIVQ